MHRPGTALVSGDKVILTRTTLEEVEKVHRETLKVVVNRVNQLVAEAEEAEAARLEAERRTRDEHARMVTERASRIRFDD
jgi:hypothetical protein